MTKKEALEFLTNEKISNNESFSTYQITLELRRATKEGFITLDGVGEILVDDEFVYNLPHTKENRQIVENVLEKYILNNSYICEWLADHRIFKPQQNPFLVHFPKKVIQDAIDKDKDKDLNDNVDSDYIIKNKVKKSFITEDERDLLLGYVSRKLSKGQYPTIKNIQSALKRGLNYSSIPVEEIEKEILNQYSISDISKNLPISFRRIISKK